MILLTSVLLISTQGEIPNYVQPYCIFRDSHHVLHKKENLSTTPVLDGILCSIKALHDIQGFFLFSTRDQSVF